MLARGFDRRGAPRRRQPTGSVARVLGAVTTVAGALVLAACGSSGSAGSSGGTSASKAAARSSASTGESGTTSGAHGGIAAGACRHVPKPASRSGERDSKPTQSLDAAHTYTVRLVTNCGAIAIQLDVQQAPKTAASFASLVRHGFYDNLTFHRVVPGFVIQGGDPNGNGTGGPGYEVVEAPPRALEYTRGVVAMAKAEAQPSGASGSQFFIVTAANADLPPQYALVGRVVSGDDAVQAISRVPTEAGPDGEHGTPSIPIVIERAELKTA
jgi:cyclophilin family peptidyl-prolyl cis-trans isomerase